jgi:type I restriction enzyme, S subunit
MSVSGWTPTRLGDHLGIKHGWPFKSARFDERLTGKPIVVSVGNFRYTGGFRFSETDVNEYRDEYPKEYELKPGDILLIMTCQTAGGEILGIPARVPDDGRVYLHNQRLGKLVLRDESSLTADFAYWLCLWREFNRELVTSASGTKILHTAPSRIEAFKFSMPPPAQQRAISQILESFQRKIDFNRQANEELSKSAAALFDDWFVDFGPVRVVAEGGSPYLATEIWQRFPSRLDEDDKPEGWHKKPLDQVATFLNGLALQKFPAAGSAYLPVIKIAQLRTGTTLNSDRASLDIPTQYVVDDGDVLFSWSGSLLHRVWTGGKGALNQHLFKVTSKLFPKWFVFHWISHHMEEFRAIAASKATTMGHIQRHHLSEAQVTIPSEAVMLAADEVIGPLFDRAIANDLESRSLTQTRDELLPKLMSGAVRVQDAEKIAETVL